ncbi:MAG: hypothetical protein LBH13_02235 [Cellulomonadaceae bacterium]|jgi:PHD/YefM family antitoxin component YafN of YafNO toxin-antitoxin module|nr:hypothetical protein [Cellulomonadaceae bacterium]
MKTINRRTLNQTLASVLDSVLDTGEPVRVEGRDGRAVMIERAKAETTWERWQREGKIRPGRQTSAAEWRSRPKMTLPEGETVESILDEIRGEW